MTIANVAWYRVCRKCGGTGIHRATRKRIREYTFREYQCEKCGHQWRAIVQPAKVIKITA